jgi:hypothetical protein
MYRKMAALAVITLAGIVCWVSLAAPGRTADRLDKLDKAAADKPAPFVHVVIFTMKKDAPEGEADALIADAHELLQTIPSVRGLKVGKPSEKSSPRAAHKKYDVGLMVLFEDAEGMETYLKHPQHLKYVDKHLKHVDEEKLVVYDFVDTKK